MHAHGRTRADRANAHILWFDELTNTDVPLVGGKNASLGEMYTHLTPKGVNIPNGFAVTAGAYHYFLRAAGIKDTIRKALTGLDPTSTRDLEARGAECRGIIMHEQLPADLQDAILESYAKMEAEYGPLVDTAVRSSATAEDLPDASFAGQQETFLNVRGEKMLLDATKRCMASLFTNRAISYREIKGFDHFSIGLSVCVQKMVRSDLASSGVMFSLDTESGFKDVVTINGAWGLGENIVQGAVNPDEWYVFKPKLSEEGRHPVLSKRLGSKEMTMTYSSSPSKGVVNSPTSKKKMREFCLSEAEVEQLARWACTIEDHYTSIRGTYTPMDMEWAKDGHTGELFMVQARPETVHSQKDVNVLRTYVLDGKGGTAVSTGSSVGSRIGAGKASVILETSGIHGFNKGDVLVTAMTDPDWEPAISKAAAVVTDRGGRTCHAAIICRELGIPCIVGAGDATVNIKDGQDVTVDCSEGEKGFVWDGQLDFHVEEKDLGAIPAPDTKIMLNLANPSVAFETSFLPNGGVGLARMEFIAANHVRAHPLALLHPEKCSEADQKALAELTAGFDTMREYFVDTLAGGVGTLAAAFYPKPVILRFSDFKTNEYATLLGGAPFEPKEENPMIGWRGASRYYSDAYREGFALECEAVKKVRETMGLTNLAVMIPFCRTVTEAKAVVAEMKANGLERTEGPDGLKVMAMCEIPSNVISAEAFLEHVDGMSIGSNDLTQLTLGVDRDSALVAHVYDERDPAVKKLISDVIKVCKAKGKYVGICGQAPSDYPDFCTWLVEEGIESMSLNPDTVIQTFINVAETEARLRGDK